MLTTLLYQYEDRRRGRKRPPATPFKGSYTSPVGIGSFTMYLAGGDLTEELLSKAGNGVYITSLGASMQVPTPSPATSPAKRRVPHRERQKATHVKSSPWPVTSTSCSKNITALANNTQLPTPFGMTTFGAPSVLVEGLSIAGK